MPQPGTQKKSATVEAKNIGGISETTIDIPPGVTIVAGRNATNRTSFLQAIMAALGSNAVTLKGAADEGYVSLTLDGESYHRTLKRTENGIVMDGNPYLEDPTIAELFAFLIESNEARRAVVRGDNLRELIMRPIDTDQITAEIERLKRERDDVDERLDELDELKEELPTLEQQKQKIASEIETKRDELAEKEEEIESHDSDIEQTQEEKRKLDDKLQELQELRSDIENVRSEIDLQEESIASLKEERSELRDELTDLPESPMGDHQYLNEEISRLRDHKQQLETKVKTLQSVIQFNEEMLDGEESAVRDVLTTDDTPASEVTAQLVGDEQVACWTCGNQVRREEIEETLETVRTVRRDRMEEIRDIEDELEDLQSEQRERKRQQRRRESIEEKLTNIENELAERESTLEELRDRREQLADEVEMTENEINALESEDFSEILDLHKAANQLEFELENLESDLEDVTDQIATVEEQLSGEDELREQREQIQEELQAQRTRIDRIGKEAVEEFNEHMETVLDILEYENLERIWIERRQQTAREGRQTIEQTAFDLHVVRTTESGTTYEDTINHLSESEREVTGLTFALAGYLVHDVHETVPFMLLDSLEAIDSERLTHLISYFSENVEYLVAALLTEDAQALPEKYTYITDI